MISDPSDAGEAMEGPGQRHVIRLRGPWEKQTGDGSVFRVRVPEVSAEQPGCGEIAGAVVYRRRFHRPTGLDDGTSVWLVIERVSGSLAAVALNGQRLGNPDANGPDANGPDAYGRLEISPHLQHHNLLELTLIGEGDQPPLLDDEVRLEIGPAPAL